MTNKEQEFVSHYNVEERDRGDNTDSQWTMLSKCTCVHVYVYVHVMDGMMTSKLGCDDFICTRVQCHKINTWLYCMVQVCVCNVCMYVCVCMCV